MKYVILFISIIIGAIVGVWFIYRVEKNPHLTKLDEIDKQFWKASDYTYKKTHISDSFIKLKMLDSAKFYHNKAIKGLDSCEKLHKQYEAEGSLYIKSLP